MGLYISDIMLLGITKFEIQFEMNVGSAKATKLKQFGCLPLALLITFYEYGKEIASKCDLIIIKWMKIMGNMCFKSKQETKKIIGDLYFIHQSLGRNR